MKCIQTEQYAELTREKFYLRLIPLEEEVFRCVFSQEPITETDLDFIDPTGFSPASYSIEETEHSFRLRTSCVQAEILKEDGRIIWKRQAEGGILLEEGRKELEKIDVMRYTTGDEAPVINRVKTVDGERNFIQNLKQIADHQAYKGRLHFRWKAERSEERRVGKEC